MAVEAYEAIKKLGLRIPQDISVMGYDDQAVARHLTPPLTTLILPHREMRAWAFETALELTTAPGKRRQFPLVKLECTLVERGSVGPHRLQNPGTRGPSERPASGRLIGPIARERKRRASEGQAKGKWGWGDPDGWKFGSACPGGRAL